MSEQLSALQPVTITVENIYFEKMLEKDICNTKWRMTRREWSSTPEEATVTFNSDYTITSKDLHEHVPDIVEWKYVGPNHIGLNRGGTYVIFFNKRSLIYMVEKDVEYIGRREF